MSKAAVVKVAAKKPEIAEKIDKPHVTGEQLPFATNTQSVPHPEPAPQQTASPVTDVLPEMKTQLSDINRMIHEKAFAMKEEMDDETKRVDETHGPLFIDTPNTFDGVSNTDEKIRLMEAELVEAQRKSRKLEHEMSLLKTEFEEERKTYDLTVRDLKQELHRTAPLHDNKFFSLSKELREAMDEIKTISNAPVMTPLPTERSEQIDNNTPLQKAEPIKSSDNTDKVTINHPEGSPDMAKKVVKTEENKSYRSLAEISKNKNENVAESDAPKKPRKKKLLVTGAAAVVTLVVVGGSIGYEYLTKPTVDQKLVAEYLQKQQDGEVAGAQTTNPAQPTAKPTPSNAEVPMSETTWETFKDPILGITLQYPSNVVTLNRTDSSVTFLRKDGYLLKVQRVDTKLALKDYWDQIKATTLNYEVKESTFETKPALSLHLTDTTDYPGDRYLVQLKGYIFDIWYATKSEKYSSDDIARAQKMLTSISFE